MQRPSQVAGSSGVPLQPKTQAAAAAPLGCCTITQAGVIPDQQIPNITRAECEAIANARLGAVFHWVEGDCAE
jgi:hypothetical protein